MWNDLLDKLKQLPSFSWNIVLAGTALLTGFIFKVLVASLLRGYSRRKQHYSLLRSILLRLNKPFTAFLPLFTFNMVLPFMELNKKQYYYTNKVTNIFLLISFSVVLISVVKIFEDFLLHIYDLTKTDNLRERKIRTQIIFIRKLVIGLVVTLTVGSVLLSFNSLRRIGTGLLTGVGISSIIVGFAAQRSLGNLLAGLQIAFTQPLRLDDVLVVEGEWGRVEEITMTYVVLAIWDQRRLILPINYFIEKPFQNWTRTTSEILGTVFLHLDYNAPFEKIRKEFDRLLLTTDLWDRRTGVMQVTESTQQTVEVRLLVSAFNSGQVFDLRCYIREHIIEFIQKNCSEALPKTRAVVSSEDINSQQLL